MQHHSVLSLESCCICIHSRCPFVNSSRGPSCASSSSPVLPCVLGPRRRFVRMAVLAVIASKHVNGVAAIHSGEGEGVNGC